MTFRLDKLYPSKEHWQYYLFENINDYYVLVLKWSLF